MTETVFFADGVTVAGTRRTRDGYLVADCRVARGGNVQTYTGDEMGKPDMAQVRIYRDPDVVFDKAAMGTWAFKPVTVEHPDEWVNADNWRDHSVGMTGGEIARDGEFLRLPMVLMDGKAIAAVEDGTRELSCGYSTTLAWAAGTTPTGEAYDAKMVSLVGNHVAVVPKGRAGPECRFGDAALRAAGQAAPPTPPPHSPQGDRPVADETNQRAVLIDGLTVRTNDAGAEAIARLDKLLNDAKGNVTALESRLRDAETGHRAALDAANGQVAALRQEMARALETKDGEIAGLNTAHAAALAAKDGEIAVLQTATSDAALDARVAQRSALIAQVAPILGAGFNPAGLSDAAIRKSVVVKAMGEKLADADSKGDAFFDAAFTTVMALAPKAPPAAAPAVDPLRGAIAGGIGAPLADAQPSPFAAHLGRLTNAWKSNPGAEA